MKTTDITDFLAQVDKHFPPPKNFGGAHSLTRKGKDLNLTVWVEETSPDGNPGVPYAYTFTFDDKPEEINEQLFKDMHESMDQAMEEAKQKVSP